MKQDTEIQLELQLQQILYLQCQMIMLLKEVPS